MTTADLQTAQWASFVAPTPAWGCVVIGNKDQLSRFLESRPKADLLVRTVSGAKCSTAKTLFREWASTLQFPGYFGENWDAFDECMTDMSWLPSSSYVIVIDGLEAILPDEDEFRLLVEVLQDCASDGVRAGWQVGVSELEARLTFLFRADDYDAAQAKFLHVRTSIPFYRLP